MWNFLIALIIGMIIWYFGASSLNFNPNQQSSLKIGNSSIKKPVSTRSAVDAYTHATVEQVNQARQMQQQEQENLGN